MFQENKARQFFRKMSISYPPMRIRTCAYQRVRNVFFQKVWRALFSWNTHFEIRPFALLQTKYQKQSSRVFIKKRCSENIQQIYRRAASGITLRHGVLLLICCIFPEHLFSRALTEICFWSKNLTGSIEHYAITMHNM